MNYHYCQFCFKKTAQGSDIVKFCAHCGKSFSEVSSSSQASSNKTTTHSIPTSQRDRDQNDNREVYKRLLAKRGISIDDDEEDDKLGGDLEDNGNDNDDDVSVPSISKLQVEVDIPQDTGIPIRSLARSAKREPRNVNSKTKAVKVNKKKFLEEYLKSASSLRPKK